MALTAQEDKLRRELSGLLTEQRNPETVELDRWTALEIVSAMNREDRKVPLAMEAVLEHIAAAVDVCVAVIRGGGRIFYLGAGTSGRLAVLDAAECPPTFGVSPDLFQAVMAGGEQALFHAVEGAEDDREQAKRDLTARGFGPKDLLIGVAASGRTPYVLGGLAFARELGAERISVAATKDALISEYSTIAIEILTGPELLTGSTRLKAGTAQKMCLNMISTATLVRLGHCYSNWMVQLAATNEKLKRRTESILMAALDLDVTAARSLLAEAKGELKCALTMGLLKVGVDEARRQLEAVGGRIVALDGGNLER